MDTLRQWRTVRLRPELDALIDLDVDEEVLGHVGDTAENYPTEVVTALRKIAMLIEDRKIT